MDDLFELFLPKTPEARARALRLFWVISLGMMLLGFLFILLFWNN